VVLGGGNAKHLDELPPKTRLGHNEDAFLGGFRLWVPRKRTWAHHSSTGRIRGNVFFLALPSWALALIVLCVIGAATLAGHGLGRRFHEHHAALKEPFGVLQGALLGIVALILAFGLSLALGRYEDRRGATVAEANAIGDTYLRAQLIADPARAQSI